MPRHVGPLTERVLRGIALLDERQGQEWVWRVDPGTLEMDTACGCVLGQLYGGGAHLYGYDTGRRALDLDPGGLVATGFCSPVTLSVIKYERYYHHLDRLWCFAIHRLREQRPCEAVTTDAQ